MPDIDALDLQRLQEALALAEGAIGLSEPNPRVGCVLGLPDGKVLGRGHTQQVGGAHAEVVALRDAQAAGHGAALRGATAWVTLEPCAHHGRTPPCTDALIAAGLARVVVALPDPFPQVAGRGIAQLRAAGVRVEVLPAPGTATEGDNRAAALVQAAHELNIGFFSRQQRGRPWVRVKLAASMDGLTALPDGRSQWITGPAARADGHAWRRRAGAVLTGSGTVLADDPRLDVREVPTTVQPLRLVLDRRGRVPATARIWAEPGRAIRLGAGGTPLPQGSHGNCDLHALLAWLASEHHINELHVEAGPTLAGALHSAGLVDEWLLYLAPRLLGAGRPLLAGFAAASLPAEPEWRLHETTVVGEDLRVRLHARHSASSA